jgi:hypothetical protein
MSAGGMGGRFSASGTAASWTLPDRDHGRHPAAEGSGNGQAVCRRRARHGRPEGHRQMDQVSALDMGVPAPTIAEAVFARCLSAVKEERVAASKNFPGPRPTWTGDRALVQAVHDALYCSKICSYAQGFQLMRAAQGNTTGRSTSARSPRSGAAAASFAPLPAEDHRSLRARSEAGQPAARPVFQGRDPEGAGNWRKVIALAATHGISAPTFTRRVGYYDGYRAEGVPLPANLLQGAARLALRLRTPTSGSISRAAWSFFHIDWPARIFGPARAELAHTYGRRQAGLLSAQALHSLLCGVGLSGVLQDFEESRAPGRGARLVRFNGAVDRQSRTTRASVAERRRGLFATGRSLRPRMAGLRTAQMCSPRIDMRRLSGPAWTGSPRTTIRGCDC